MRLVVYFVPPPSLPLKELLVKHIKQAWMSFPILKGNDIKKTYRNWKLKQFNRKGQDRIVESLFSAVEIYEVPFDWCTYVWFLFLKGQFFSGNSHRIYLLGNPVVWWGNLVFLGTFLIIFAYNSIREQRGYQDSPSVKGNVNELIDNGRSMWFSLYEMC